MSYPPGFLFQPSVSLALPSCPSLGSGVMLGPRPEELARSSGSGSAFAPYSGSSTSPGFNAHLPFGGETRAAAAISSYVSPAYDASSGISGSLDYHPFGPLGAFPYGDPAYRKNATRDATATLKAWLNEHRKNPYPTKGEKIMLAIITKMTLTQVSTWFANARRRLKKENKMTWTPRNRTGCGPPSVLDTDPDFQDSGDQRPLAPGPRSEGPLPHTAPLLLRATGTECSSTPPSTPLSKEQGDSCGPSRGPTVAPKPKLWSLAEIATSSDKSPGAQDSTPLPHSPALPRHFYYPSPFLQYSTYSPLGTLPPPPLNTGPQDLRRCCSEQRQETVG
ncbi:hypothetical protein INR49_020664 [Caranx melampygus]|nr:hypothetical protein INR49_020664 [Caranx melampygus]